MRAIFTRKEFALAVACALAFGVLSETVNAQVRQDEHAVVMDSSGAPVISGFGLCVRSGFGPAPSWNAKCHGELPAPVAQRFAPVAAFDSDKSALRPAGRDTLDQFVARIRGLETQTIVAIGYADRMGSDAANQHLSQQRVDSVKGYLVGKGIVADRVQTSARGETQPTTLAGVCKDANNAKNVACMQPDRHVFIEVSGTRIAQ